MAIVCNIVALSELRLCDANGFTNVLMAQPAFSPSRNEETGYRPSPDDLKQVESFVDECLAALQAAKREHNLVVFPEAFLPISRVPNLIEFVSTDCPANTVIIAGVESLSVQDVLESDALPLADDMRERLQIALKPHHRFVNAVFLGIEKTLGSLPKYLVIGLGIALYIDEQVYGKRCHRFKCIPCILESVNEVNWKPDTGGPLNEI